MTPPRRRWLRFSLRTLFAVVTVFCVWLGLYGIFGDAFFAVPLAFLLFVLYVAGNFVVVVAIVKVTEKLDGWLPPYR